MKINELSPVPGSTHVAKRKGRGHATGNGKTAGSKCTYGVKILGNGEITRKITVKATAFSESAKQKIEAAGGKAEVV